jgi:uncharacterized membrane protein (DUF2068 family)
METEIGVIRTMETGTEASQVSAKPAQGSAVAHRDRGLLLIGGFKLLEAVFFFLVGVGALHYVHRDLADEALKLATRLRMDLDGRLVSWVLDHIDVITAHRLKQIGIATFFYSGLRIAEGVGLVMEKLWAEYLTVGATTIFLPWELYEIIRRPDWIRVGLLVINLLVLGYLSWALRRTLRARGLAR